MKKQTQIARNEGRFYLVSIRQMRYFPMKRAEAEMLLATGEAIEVAYLPFSRSDLHSAAYEARQLLSRIAA